MKHRQTTSKQNQLTNPNKTVFTCKQRQSTSKNVTRKQRQSTSKTVTSKQRQTTCSDNLNIVCMISKQNIIIEMKPNMTLYELQANRDKLQAKKIKLSVANRDKLQIRLFS